MVLPRNIKHVVLAIPLWMVSTLNCELEKESYGTISLRKLRVDGSKPSLAILMTDDT